MNIFILFLKSKLVNKYKSYPIIQFIPSQLIIPFWLSSTFFKLISFSTAIYLMNSNGEVHIFIKKLYLYLGIKNLSWLEMNIFVISSLIVIYSIMYIPTIIVNKHALKQHPLLFLMHRNHKLSFTAKLGYIVPDIINSIILLIAYMLSTTLTNKYSYLPIFIQSAFLIHLLLLILFDYELDLNLLKFRNVCLFVISIPLGQYFSNSILTFLKDSYSLNYAGNFVEKGTHLYSVFLILIITIFIISKASSENKVSILRTENAKIKLINMFYMNGFIYICLMGLLIGVLIQSQFIFTDYFLLIILSSYPHLLISETSLKRNPHYYEYMAQSKYYPFLEYNFKKFQFNFNMRIINLLVAPYIIITILWLVHSYDFIGLFTIMKYLLITILWSVLIQEAGFFANYSQESDIYTIYKQDRVFEIRALIEGIFFILVPILGIPEIMYITLIINKLFLVIININIIIIIFIFMYFLFKYREHVWTISKIRKHTSI